MKKQMNIEEIRAELQALSCQVEGVTRDAKPVLRAYPNVDPGIGVVVKSDFFDEAHWAEDLEDMMRSLEKSYGDADPPEDRLWVARQFDGVARTASAIAKRMLDAVPKEVIEAYEKEWEEA
jgi:hypothetical protein